MRFLRPSNCPWWKNRRPGDRIRDDGRGLVHAGREGRGGPGLVVVLQEPGELVLVVEPGVQVLAHRPRVSLAQAVVEPLVVGVVEPLLLHRPFQVPVDLGHEAGSSGRRSRTRCGRLGPEQRRPAAPGPLEDLRQDEHGHVAAHAVALPGDPQQLADHRLLRGRIAVVELQRVRPAGEVRVAAVGQDATAPWAIDPAVVLRARARAAPRCRGRSSRGAPRPRGDPGPCGWGRSRACSRRPRAPEPLAQPGQRRIAAQTGVHRVAGDREPGAGDVLLAQVRQRLLELPAPLGVGARDPLRGRPGLPDAQEPDPVETHLGQAVQLGVRNVVQRGRPAQGPGQLGQPDAGVDLVERGIERSRHDGPPGSCFRAIHRARSDGSLDGQRSRSVHAQADRLPGAHPQDGRRAKSNAGSLQMNRLQILDPGRSTGPDARRNAKSGERTVRYAAIEHLEHSNDASGPFQRPSSSVDLLSAHLLPHDPGLQAPALGLQQGLGVDTTEDVQEGSDQAGPARLVAGPEPRAVVAVEVLVEQDQIAPVRIVLELGRPAVDRPPSIGIAQERARQPAGKSPAPLRTASCTGRNRSGTATLNSSP